MESNPPEFYASRRKSKKQEWARHKKKKALKRSAIFALTGIAILFFYLIAAASISEVLLEQKRKPQPVKQPPLISYCGQMEITLPVSKENFSALAFHSAYNPHAYNLTPVGRKINTKKMSKAKARKLLRNTENLSYVVMDRSGRNGRKLSAIDLGAEALSKVKAPISGSVALVKKYKLYSYLDDYEVHILPLGYRDRHMVIIHITDIRVKKGDSLSRGKTVIGRVRQLSKQMKTQLREYSKDRGDHIHLQINKILPTGECTREN